MSDLAQEHLSFFGSKSSKRCEKQHTGANSNLHECQDLALEFMQTDKT
jgi:hypothetical protein